MLACGLQVLLVVATDGQPVRFGVPLPAAALAEGLRLRGSGALQWRRLPVGDAASDPVWVEVAIVAPTQEARVLAGGELAVPDGCGRAFVRERRERVLPYGRETATRWRWCDGSEDEQVRIEFCAPVSLDGEDYAVGEARTRWNDAALARARPVCTLPRRSWEGAGLLGPAGRQGEFVRRHLALVRPCLVELPGERGAGDFLRTGGVVTNLEFDTGLGLLHQALSAHDEQALRLARRCAVHLCDRDLDLRSGLPFAHGADHRSSPPAPGHAWLRGLLFTGLVTADDGLIHAAHGIARALAASPPLGEGRQELARDYGWPLHELESWLAVSPDPVLAAAADRLATAIDRRFDPVCRVYRFGEGELGAGVYLERGWITGGIVLPAMRLHLRRRPDAQRLLRLRAAQAALQDRLGAPLPGLPTHWRCAAGRTFAEHRAIGDPRALLMLEGLESAELRRLLRREAFRDALAGVPRPDDPDLATSFSLVARCQWVWR